MPTNPHVALKTATAVGAGLAWLPHRSTVGSSARMIA